MYDVLSIQRENGDGTKTLGKSDISKETKENKEETRVAVGVPAYQRANERRAPASIKYKDEDETKQT